MVSTILKVRKKKEKRKNKEIKVYVLLFMKNTNLLKSYEDFYVLKQRTNGGHLKEAIFADLELRMFSIVLHSLKSFRKFHLTLVAWFTGQLNTLNDCSMCSKSINNSRNVLRSSCTAPYILGREVVVDL